MTRHINNIFLAAAFLLSATIQAAPDKHKYDFNLSSLSGKKSKSRDFQGQVTVVGFWASWCEPCKRQLEWLRRLQSEIGSKDLAIIAINEDFEHGSTKKFIASNGQFNFPTLIDKKHKTFESFNAKSLSSIFVFDKEGKLLISTGGSYPAQDQILKELILTALK